MAEFLRKGPRGLPGEPGPPGPAGDDGPPGPQGDPGADSTVPGPQGDPGVKGDKGDKGDPGNQGVKGDTGDAGPQGPPGNEGVDGPQGEQGVEGPQGIAGPQGPAGSGVTMKGSVATSGNLPSSGNNQGDAYIVQSDDSLWVWDGTQWVSGGSIQGPQGQQGIQGPQGLQGIQGVKGDTGNTGATGSAGATGSTGPAGATGPAGPQGIQGVKGDTGATGATGPAGSTGATGATGPKGDPGPGGGTSLAVGSIQDITTTRTALENNGVGIEIDHDYPCEVSVNYRVNVPNGAAQMRIYLVASADGGSTWHDADQVEWRWIGGDSVGSQDFEGTLRTMLPPAGKVFTYIDNLGSAGITALNWVRKQRLGSAGLPGIDNPNGLLLIGA
jgi:hypothetical protein